MAVLAYLFQPAAEWTHLVRTVLATYTWNTVIVVFGVVVLSMLLAVPSAWFVSRYEFWGRDWLSWALVLPLAIPTYVSGFVFYRGTEAATDFLIWVKLNVGIDAYFAAELGIRYGLLMIALAAVLYPYVYLACRASFAQQGKGPIEAARCLGRSRKSVFFSVALPMARPALAAGGLLVVMEVINDYGAVNIFGVPTLTEGIFRTWFNMGDKVSALRLAGVVMFVVAGLLLIEQFLRGRARYVETEGALAVPQRECLERWRQLRVLLWCLVPLVIGFCIPVIRLASWAVMYLKENGWGSLPFGEAFLRGTGLAVVTAIVVTLIATFFIYAVRLKRCHYRRCANRVANLGYTMPGTVVAVGVMAVFGAFDRASEAFLPVISGTLLAIAFAYFVRFFAIPSQLIRSGMDRMGKPLEEASRVLGERPLNTFLRVNVPLLRGAIFAAAMLMFVDILKELPLTLILRPANFETLATIAFSLAKEGRLQACALPSLMIIAISGIGLAFMQRWMSHLDRVTSRKEDCEC